MKKSTLFFLMTLFTCIIFAQKPTPKTCNYSEINSILLNGFADDFVYKGKLKSLRIERFQLVENFGEFVKGDITNSKYYEFNELEALTKEISTVKIEANEALKIKEFQSQSTINYRLENVNLVTIINVKYDSNFYEKYEFHLNESCAIKYYDLYENEKFKEKVKFSYKKDTTDINYYYSNGKLSYNLKWIRSKNKKLLKAFSDNVDFNSTYSYDKNGNVIKVISKDGTETYKYLKCDSLGNWLERQIFKNNKPFLYEIREVNLY